MRKITSLLLSLLFLLCGLSNTVGAVVPDPDTFLIYSASSSASATGVKQQVLGYASMAVQSTITAAWDGTLTYQITIDGTNYQNVNCYNPTTKVLATTTTSAAYVVCPVGGAKGFRVNISGRTVGTVTVTGVGIYQAAGGLSMPSAGFAGFANPTATVGLTAVNGTATTAMRSDAAPPLSQAIAPTWTELHTHTVNPLITNAAPGIVFTDTTGTAKSLTLAVDANVAQLRESAGASGSLLTLDLANNRLGLGTAAPADSLHLHALAGANTGLRLSDGDVVHSMTTQVPADVFGSLGIVSSGVGGLNIRGFTDTGAQSGVALLSQQGATTTTVPGIQITAYKWDGGTSRVALADTEILLGVSNGGATNLFSISGGGNIGTVTAWGTNAVKVWGLGGSTAPTTSPADTVQLWGADGNGAGTHDLFVRTEEGAIHGLTGRGIIASLVAPQTIAAGNTITADGCGGVKRITSAGAVTTSTTDTITAPSAVNAGCAMKVCNVGANNITLDKNANILLVGGADVVLAANCCVDVVSTGAGGVWKQTTAQLCST